MLLCTVFCSCVSDPPAQLRQMLRTCCVKIWAFSDLNHKQSNMDPRNVVGVIVGSCPTSCC